MERRWISYRAKMQGQRTAYIAHDVEDRAKEIRCGTSQMSANFAMKGLLTESTIDVATLSADKPAK